MRLLRTMPAADALRKWEVVASHLPGRTPTGATALKRRQLRAAGWALLPVPYWEWSALGSKAAKQAYLRTALEGLEGTDGAGYSA